MSFPAFLDTCTIFGAAINDFVLDLAERGTFRPLCSEHVLAELERSLVRRGIDPDAVAYRIGAMRTAFPDANVTGYEDLISQMTCDDDDRHVLAAAVRANAEVIVTFNLKHFPQSSVEPYQISTVHPDDFLLDQLDLYPQATLQSLEDTSGRYEKPAMTVDTFLGLLAKAGAPKFAEAAAEQLR
ncbi:MAG: PIN domain-containing protein [Actinomycetota bacterium]|nr:PIN domain-containing protein [Actinomycetota bacterium]